MKITKFLFDLGNVFFDWDPHYVFKNIIPDQTKREYFMNTIAFPHLDMRCDAGVKIDDAVKDGLLENHEKGRVDIHIDQLNRKITIRDNGAGLSNKDFELKNSLYEFF